MSDEPKYWITETQLFLFAELNTEWPADAKDREELIDQIRDNQTIDQI